jgi:hypothetical protein
MIALSSFLPSDMLRFLPFNSSSSLYTFYTRIEHIIANDSMYSPDNTKNLDNIFFFWRIDWYSLSFLPPHVRTCTFTKMRKQDIHRTHHDQHSCCIVKREPGKCCIQLPSLINLQHIR